MPVIQRVKLEFMTASKASSTVNSDDSSTNSGEYSDQFPLAVLPTLSTNATTASTATSEFMPNVNTYHTHGDQGFKP